MLRRCVQIGLLAALAGQLACASLLGRKWQRFQARDGIYSVEFPPGEVQTIPTSARPLYRVIDGNSIYAASHFDAETAALTPQEVDAAYSSFAAGFAKSVRGKVAGASPAVELNMNGVSTRIKTAQGACDLRLYNRRIRFYVLAICYPDGGKDGAAFARFFESLTIQ